MSVSHKHQPTTNIVRCLSLLQKCKSLFARANWAIVILRRL